jgi:hypothetical protein
VDLAAAGVAGFVHLAPFPARRRSAPARGCGVSVNFTYGDIEVGWLIGKQKLFTAASLLSYRFQGGGELGKQPCVGGGVHVGSHCLTLRCWWRQHVFESLRPLRHGTSSALSLSLVSVLRVARLPKGRRVSGETCMISWTIGSAVLSSSTIQSTWPRAASALPWQAPRQALALVRLLCSLPRERLRQVGRHFDADFGCFNDGALAVATILSFTGPVMRSPRRCAAPRPACRRASLPPGRDHRALWRS